MQDFGTVFPIKVTVQGLGSYSQGTGSKAEDIDSAQGLAP